MNKLVVGMGEALWDVLPDGKKIGGAPANFAYHAGQFGLESCAVSAIGNDSLGDELIEKFDTHGVKHHLARVDFPTGTVQVQLDAAGVPCYDICENVAWDNIPFTPELESMARRTAAVCFGSLAQRNSVSRDTILRFLDAMPDDALRIFDINLRQKFYGPEVIDASIRRCNVLKINDEELETVAPMFGIAGESLPEKARALREKYGLGTLILTCGTEGSYVFSEKEESYLPTPKVEVADTVGAGDSFTGAFIATLLKGGSLREAHEAAVRTSAFVCTCHGAMPRYR